MVWFRDRIILLLWIVGIVCVTCEESTTKAEEAPEQVKYTSPRPAGLAYIAEHFDDPDAFRERWIRSEAKKDGADADIAKYDGEWALEAPEKFKSLQGNLGLVLKSKARHSAIGAKLDRPFKFVDKPFLMQYEVQFQNGQECGGAYVKLLSDNLGLEPRQLTDKTPYTIMFGPDKCGNDHKLHFIFRHRNPKNGTYEEKHWKKALGGVSKLDEIIKDGRPHLFTLLITPDNKFEIHVDQNKEVTGSLLEDFSPPVNPPAEIEDPNDQKPSDWDDREKIPDPNAVKPEDWDEDAPKEIVDEKAEKPVGWLDDERELIPDPEASKPKDWDNEMDGEWEAPLIANPKCKDVGCGEWKRPMIANLKYKGKWRAPMIENPAYKGKWRPSKIPNPDFFEDTNPFRMTAIGGVGFELWSMSDGIVFDNIIITDDPVVAQQWAQDTFVVKRDFIESSSDGLFTRFVRYSNRHPWLWAVYVVALGIPIVLIITFCCTSSKKSDDATARHKKHDDESEPPLLVDENGEEVIEEEEEGESEREGGGKDEEESGGPSNPPPLEGDSSDVDGEEDVDEGAGGDRSPGSEKKSPATSTRRRPRRE